MPDRPLKDMPKQIQSFKHLPSPKPYIKNIAIYNSKYSYTHYLYFTSLSKISQPYYDCIKLLYYFMKLLVFV